ncbi:MAG: 16S rRNA (uracil(1498)-N(3))-methyltransferase [bacterium]|nr:16S rRNA (uracil(1498)-N(3))-methyltransferase [bacterium]
MRRIYLDPADCEKKYDSISIKGSTFHYLSNVLRMKEGDIFIGFDGSGIEYEISIKEVENKNIKGIILNINKIRDIEPAFDIYLFQCIPKSNKMDKIICEVSQLGVKKIFPVVSSRVVPQITKENILHKKGRWRRIAVDSSKVAGRDVIMEIEAPVKFDEAIKLPADLKIIFWEKADISLRTAINNLQRLKEGASINIFIGPEGGYTDEEVCLAEEYKAISVSMGKRILRVETASVIAVALTIYELENKLIP